MNDGLMSPTLSRRELLRVGALGACGLSLSQLLAVEKSSVDSAKADACIVIYLNGGPSHIDMFDPKPELARLAGKPLPDSFPRPLTAMGVTAGTPLLASKRTFKQHGVHVLARAEAAWRFRREVVRAGYDAHRPRRYRASVERQRARCHVAAQLDERETRRRLRERFARVGRERRLG